ncbi:LPS-assembly protein LptD [Rubellimicrobium arenae]|uniref:LPS-assembly protein LptD n=1 Tax=Rubellimicrobium arenae TaxID=2817372 RepID=UPI001B30FD84|nr:LPS assembly protein LptD [Rubellimicrobium arenae]
MKRLLVLIALLLPVAARAQDSAVLVADELFVTADEDLVATGNVQAFYQGTVLSAAQVTYDRESDRLSILGPILIRDARGNILTADRADLDPRLEDGLLRGARIVLDQQLQLAANRVDRLGDVSALTATAVTSCQVCPGRTPLWEIRAGRVIHDEAAEQLYFENARFLVRGVPIFWVPRMRLPDPGNERATGLLIPQVRTSDRLGFGAKLPYFVELGPSRDVTLTPYLSSRTLTLETRYRQAFLAGDIEITGAVSRDDILPDDLRGTIAAEGEFDLGRGLRLEFSGTAVSDEGYLLDYGYSDADRLESVVEVNRVDPSSLFVADLTHIRSLRDDEDEATLPPLLGSLGWERRLEAAGGTLGFGADADGFLRTERADGAEGRDMMRAGAFAEWRGDRVLRFGLLAEGQVRGDLDTYRIVDDPDHPAPFYRIAPAAAVTLRWPLVRRGASADLIEPVASLGWSGARGEEPPDEDSRLVEFDEANLFALTRFPGEDDVEEGGRLSLGLAWTRQGPGFTSAVALGRVLRTEAQDSSGASGLSGTVSDWLLSGQVDLDGGFALDARTLLADEMDAIGKSEARVDWSNDLVTLSAAYLFLPADDAEERPDVAAEWTIDAEWRPSDRWTLRAGTRYDVANDRPARAGVGFGWRNECVDVDVSAARRYTSSDDSGPSTDFGLSVNLNGFSAGRQARVTPGQCRG